jgi:beta-phosphoglucomutase-like phosphatase (HAD superfamily)
VSSPSVTQRRAGKRGDSAGSHGARKANRPADRRVVVSAPPRPRPPELDTIAARWQLALDSATRALNAAIGSLPAPELGRRRRELVRERQQTAEVLIRLARVRGIQPVPWLSPVPLNPTMLGLPSTIRACLFDLEGVLTDSARLHAWAWGEVFDELLLSLTHKTGWQFIPFDRDADYRAYLDGRPRLEGIHAFLGSRGIRLPEGRPEDPAEAGTACGLARRKGEALTSRLRQDGVNVLGGARRYLEAASRAGLKCAVVSASANTRRMLELAGLATLLEDRVDADVIRAEALRVPPAPDLLLAACRRLGARPEEAVTFTHSPAGVAAGHAAELLVIGVGDGAEGELLRGFGAERVVPSVSTLLAPVLAPEECRL